MEPIPLQVENSFASIIHIPLQVENNFYSIIHIAKDHNASFSFTLAARFLHCAQNSRFGWSLKDSQVGIRGLISRFELLYRVTLFGICKFWFLSMREKFLC